jgi:hypothetical protein
MATTPAAEDLTRWHRWFAKECNNRAWQLADQRVRTDAENNELLNAAHAAALHWHAIGTPLNDARATMLLAHAHAACGDGQLAMRYARASHDYFAGNETPDWEIAFSHAVMAHAAAASGNKKLHVDHYAAAQAAGAAIKEAEDKAIFDASFATIPAPQHNG